MDVVARQGVQFVVTVVLARLLTPEDFGTIALVLFFSVFSTVFVQSGLSTALVQRQQTNKKEESAIFWWNLVASVIFALLIIAVSPAVAQFYQQAVLEPLMMVAAAQVVISSFGAVPQALLTRQLRFATLAKPGLIAAIISGGAGIVAAFEGWGVWALAAQILLSAVINTAGLWIVAGWRPVLHARFRTIRPLIKFGAWFSLSGSLEVLYTQGFALLLGKLYGLREVGLYNRAAATQHITTNVLATIISRVALPVFSQAAQDAAMLKRRLRATQRMVMVLNVPLLTGLALLSDLVILVLLGETWLSAAPILAVLAWGGVLFPMQVLNLQAILAQGRSDTYFKVEILKKAVGVVFAAVGSLFGIMGLAISQVVLAVVALFINVSPIGKSIAYGVGEQVGDLFGIIALTAMMAVAVILARAFIDLSPLPELVVVTAIGAAVYVACGFTFRFSAFVEALDAARPLFRRDPLRS